MVYMVYNCVYYCMLYVYIHIYVTYLVGQCIEGGIRALLELVRGGLCMGLIGYGCGFNRYFSIDMVGLIGLELVRGGLCKHGYGFNGFNRYFSIDMVGLIGILV
jgi:hypothetical protein